MVPMSTGGDMELVTSITVRDSIPGLPVMAARSDRTDSGDALHQGVEETCLAQDSARASARTAVQIVFIMEEMPVEHRVHQ